MITIGSLANLITIEQASQFGIKVSFKEYARAGIPVCIASVLVVIVWRHYCQDLSQDIDRNIKTCYSKFLSFIAGWSPP